MLKSFSTLGDGLGQNVYQDTINFVGDPGIALLTGLIIAFTLPRKFKLDYLSSSGWIGKGLLDAAIIIMITGAGGVFGKTLQNSDIMSYVQSFFSGNELGLILPFLIAAILKTSQGSSTVAIITTASIVAPLVGVSGYHTEIDKALLVLSIGAGAAVVSHANDSFFWIVTQMSGMRTKEGYRLVTPGSLTIGGTAMAGIVILSIIL